jgi:hypothetical protein
MCGRGHVLPVRRMTGVSFVGGEGDFYDSAFVEPLSGGEAGEHVLSFEHLLGFDFGGRAARDSTHGSCPRYQKLIFLEMPFQNI